MAHDCQPHTHCSVPALHSLLRVCCIMITYQLIADIRVRNFSEFLVVRALFGVGMGGPHPDSLACDMFTDRSRNLGVGNINGT